MMTMAQQHRWQLGPRYQCLPRARGRSSAITPTLTIDIAEYYHQHLCLINGHVAGSLGRSSAKCSRKTRLRSPRIYKDDVSILLYIPLSPNGYAKQVRRRYRQLIRIFYYTPPKIMQSIISWLLLLATTMKSTRLIFDEGIRPKPVYMADTY